MLTTIALLTIFSAHATHWGQYAVYLSASYGSAFDCWDDGINLYETSSDGYFLQPRFYAGNWGSEGALTGLPGDNIPDAICRRLAELAPSRHGTLKLLSTQGAEWWSDTLQVSLTVNHPDTFQRAMNEIVRSLTATTYANHVQFISEGKAYHELVFSAKDVDLPVMRLTPPPFPCDSTLQLTHPVETIFATNAPEQAVLMDTGPIDIVEEDPLSDQVKLPWWVIASMGLNGLLLLVVVLQRRKLKQHRA